MKKVIAMLLSLALLLGCAAAVAEEPAKKEELGKLNVFGSFTIQAAIPEGYEVTRMSDPVGQESLILADMKSEDETKPRFGLIIAFNDTITDYDRLNDVDDELLAFFESTYTDQNEDYQISYAETEHGTKLLLALDPAEDGISSIYTIYKGYEIELYIAAAPGQTLTQDQLDLCVKFLSDLDFIEN